MNSSTQMNQQDVDAVKVSRSNRRLFTFGCSFTNYQWPTWADIVGQEFKEHQNWGAVGGGNLFILCSLLEAIQRESISINDTVIVMWSSIGREDRWIKGRWETPGSIYNQLVYPKDWVDKFADPDGYLIRDAALISAVMNTLDNIKCEYYMLSMLPFNIVNDADLNILQKIKSKFNLLNGTERHNTIDSISDTSKVLEIYQDVFDRIRPSVFETIFDNDWYSRKGFKSMTWIETSYRDSKNTWAQHWPPYEDFINKDVDDKTLHEIKQVYDFDNLDQFLEEIKRFESRNDQHPTPLEHLEYLDSVLPEILISQETRSWTEKKHLDAEKGITWETKKVERL